MKSTFVIATDKPDIFSISAVTFQPSLKTFTFLSCAPILPVAVAFQESLSTTCRLQLYSISQRYFVRGINV